MDVNDQFELEHLYLTERTCRVCGESKDLIDGFYRIRKNKYQSSSYAYECKSCTIKRVTDTRKNRPRSKIFIPEHYYPDW